MVGLVFVFMVGFGIDDNHIFLVLDKTKQNICFKIFIRTLSTLTIMIGS